MNEMERHSIGGSGVEISQIGLGGYVHCVDVAPCVAALAWVLHQPGVATAIAGSSSETHTRDNAGAARLALSPEILEQIEELTPLGHAQVVSA